MASNPFLPISSSNLVGECEVLAVAEDSVVDRVDTVGRLQPMQGVLFVQPSLGGYLGSSEGLPAGIAPLEVCSFADFKGSAHQMPNGFAGKPIFFWLHYVVPSLLGWGRVSLLTSSLPLRVSPVSRSQSYNRDAGGVGGRR